jgi:ATP-dependent exoDNAse (exonuclease V) beta subunit
MVELHLHRASAGSGKTYRLALYFISHVLGEKLSDGSWRLYPANVHCRHREILAITFTNKATEEMKQRIMRELAKLAGSPLMAGTRSNYEATLRGAEYFNCTEEELRRAARRALTDLLYDFGGFNVSTIDSFFQAVLRTFAYEADLSGNYDLQIDEDFVISNAIAEMVQMVVGRATGSSVSSARRRAVTQWLQTYMKDKIDEGETFNIFNPTGPVRSRLLDFTRHLFNEEYKCNKADIDPFICNTDNVNTLQQALVGKRKQLRENVSKLAAELLEKHNDNLEKRSLLAYVRKCAGSRVIEAPTEAVYRLYSLQSPDLYLNATARTKMTDEKKQSLFAAVNEFMEPVLKLRKCEIMLAQIYNMGLFSEIIQQIEAQKVENNTIMLSDTNTLLNRIIGDSSTPFIYERTGQVLRHFLIDEFQDTSRLQWQNLKPLILESLSKGDDDLIIGDVKQCIYRFRNSDPNLLASGIGTDSDLKKFVHGETYDTNYRSARTVVEFNNRLFRSLANDTGNADVYVGMEQRAFKANVSGYVDLAILPNENFVERALDRMVTCMRRQLDNGYSAADIVVLVRWRTDGVKVVERLLKEGQEGGALHGVQVLSDEALLVNSSPAVQYVITTLRDLCATPTPSALLQRSNSMTERDIAWLNQRMKQIAEEQNLEPYAALDATIAEFHRNGFGGRESVQELRHRFPIEGRALCEVVEAIIANLPESEWLQSDAAYLCALQDLVLDFSQSNSPDLHSFLRWWDEGGVKSALGMASGVNAIRVMTIHKSKGLEAPCVHIPLLAGSLMREDSYRWYDATKAFASLELTCDTPQWFPMQSVRELIRTEFAGEYERLCAQSVLDELNVLYVAFTRAKRELIVSVKTMSKEDAKIEAAYQKDRTAPKSYSIAARLVSALNPQPSPTDENVLRHFEGMDTKNDEDADGKEEPDAPQNYPAVVTYSTEPVRTDVWSSTELDLDA